MGLLFSLFPFSFLESPESKVVPSTYYKHSKYLWNVKDRMGHVTQVCLLYFPDNEPEAIRAMTEKSLLCSINSSE